MIHCPTNRFSDLPPGFAIKRSGKLAALCQWTFVFLLGWLGIFASATQTRAAESSLSEYQVKSLFLVNFARYVEWPATAFPEANAPIIIGITGENNFGSHLEKAIDGKTVAGHPIRVLAVEKDEDFAKCEPKLF